MAFNNTVSYMLGALVDTNSSTLMIMVAGGAPGDTSIKIERQIIENFGILFGAIICIFTLACMRSFRCFVANLLRTVFIMNKNDPLVMMSRSLCVKKRVAKKSELGAPTVKIPLAVKSSLTIRWVDGNASTPQGRPLWYFEHEKASEDECNRFCGMVQCPNEVMKMAIGFVQRTAASRLRFTGTTTMRSYIVGTSVAATTSSSTLARPVSLVSPGSILKVSRYGGRVVELDGDGDGDGNEFSPADLGLLMWGMQIAEDDKEVKEIYADALRGAKMLWSRAGYDAEEVAVVVADGEEDFLAPDDDVDADTAEEAVIVHDAVVLLEEEEEEEDAIVTEEEEDAIVEEEEEEELLLETAAEIVDDDLGTAWVATDDSGVRVRRSRRVLSASNTLGSCWIQQAGRTVRRSRRLL